jgi:hypothetical protein
MIGVIADSAEREVVCEFFELFKTPWEFYRSDGRYEAVLCAGDRQPDETAKIVLLYAGTETAFDREHKIQTGLRQSDPRILTHQGARIPVYGGTITFPENRDGILTDERSHECVAYLDRSGEGTLGRIGYDLFSEVRTLLAVGQPVANANIPALESHIALLRNLITGCGIPLVEIPPVPDGYRFIACLTHDVDHPSIRQHKWDHTTFGFLHRALFGSLRQFIGKRMPLGDLMSNWAAAVKLPFVHLGLAKDFWRNFDDQYLELEQGQRSTFFVIPFKDRPGGASHGPAPRRRAAKYCAADIADTIKKLQTAGCEVALHGIDAWRDTSKGREELEEIRRLTGVSETGVRMHWLYFDQQSPGALENAGAAYDSSIGYNETVGYRAGTTQAYKPLNSTRLVELPLHVMDTALFYPPYLGLSQREAKTVLSRMVDNAVQFGGCLTVNWHDRSLAPERLWGACYRELVQDLKRRGAWFSTAGQTVSWFRKRRSVVFESDSNEPAGVRARVAPDRRNGLPGLRLRIHKARESDRIAAYASEDYVDLSFDESSIGTRVPCGASC